eukprot:758033-Hanusia_phi.AAC.1
MTVDVDKGVDRRGGGGGKGEGDGGGGGGGGGGGAPKFYKCLEGSGSFPTISIPSPRGRFVSSSSLRLAPLLLSSSCQESRRE